MDFENKNINTAINSENAEKKSKAFWKHFGLVTVALLLALLTVIIINL